MYKTPDLFRSGVFFVIYCFFENAFYQSILAPLVPLLVEPLDPSKERRPVSSSKNILKSDIRLQRGYLKVAGVFFSKK